MHDSYTYKDLSKQSMNLIAECISGNASASKQLYELYKVKTYAICVRYMRYKEESEDMFQDGWIKAFKKLEQYDLSLIHI